MRRPSIRVSPSPNYCKHSRISVTLEVGQPLPSTELVRLARTLRRWTGQPVRVALCAGDELGWLQEWACALEGVLEEVGQIEFQTCQRSVRDPNEGLPF
jgi:hypothetical protein